MDFEAIAWLQLRGVTVPSYFGRIEAVLCMQMCACQRGFRTLRYTSWIRYSLSIVPCSASSKILIYGVTSDTPKPQNPVELICQNNA